MKVFIFLLLTILFWGIAPLFDKIGVKQLNPIAGIFYRNITIAVIFSIIYYLYRNNLNVNLLKNFNGVICFVISGILAGVFGVWFYFKALNLADASLVVPIAATYPLVTALLSAIILNEHLSVVRIIGILLTIIGIILITK